ncbi:Uncharacterized protein TCM_016113 [Theobroma cacao]|uniref:Uncharacterized protein n=1 Tax=Theobroma cacao TaxID=3641 RepID=A0A061G4N8_THECC|nr:Uncharacterized protein TCM_016113 [Theobroma cacao]
MLETQKIESTRLALLNQIQRRSAPLLPIAKLVVCTRKNLEYQRQNITIMAEQQHFSLSFSHKHSTSSQILHTFAHKKQQSYPLLTHSLLNEPKTRKSEPKISPFSSFWV